MDQQIAVHSAPDPEDRAQAFALNRDAVSRETWARLDAFVALLIERQQRMNLIGPSTVRHLWTRHVADSLQLLRLAPDARRWCDLGSGAGFPGLVIACALADASGAQVHLVESIAKKASFLRDCAKALQLPAIVHHQRIEDFTRANTVAFDVVTARALAPLDQLLRLANPLLKTGALGLFPKGQDVEAELTLASKSWKIKAELVPSNTDPHGRVVLVRHVARL
ncbi:MAG TPA: 16S rRNA (guanine(527)-N(7))-methyltransferase RsmG [Xanthobacteraceae bacterium]|nr:16S rRNA (guanine(527)-N(7))-methyltransferase RsmG [Xanthobacteraceae bacterium]